MRVNSFKTASQIGQAMASHVMEKFAGTAQSAPFLIGLPTGSSPLPFFGAFIDLAAKLPNLEKARLSNSLHIVVMDDFVNPHTRENIALDDPWSAVGFIRLHFVNELQMAVAPAQIPDQRILFPTVGRVSTLKKRILTYGGLDVQVVATDPYEGHVAQNFSGQPFTKTEMEKTGKLSDSFIRHHDWAKQYLGVTFDLNDFTEMVTANPSGEFLLVVIGEAKHGVLHRVLSTRSYDPQLPLSFLWLSDQRTSVFTDMSVDPNPQEIRA